MKIRSKKYKYLAIISGMIGVIIISYLWKTFVDRGIYADETGTGGYTTWFEMLLIGVGLSLLIATIVFLIKSVGDRK